MLGDLSRATTDRPARDPTPLPIGFPVGAGLVAAVGVLVSATFLPWLDGLSGWELLSSANNDLRVGSLWWIAVLAPVTALLAAVALLWSRRLARLPLVLVTAAASYGLVNLKHEDLHWPGWGLGLALFAYPVALLCGLVLLVRPWKPLPPNGRVVAVGVVVAVALGTGIVGGGGWYAGRVVAASTAGSVPTPRVAGAAGQELWRIRSDVSDRIGPVVLAGGVIAIGRSGEGDLSVLTAATGAVRWHYTRRNVGLVDLAASRDERTLVARFTVGGRDTLLGFDATTGTVRWQWWPAPDAAGSQIEIRPDVIIDAGFTGSGTVVAVDPVTGRQLWRRGGFWAPHVGCGHLPSTGNEVSVAADGDLTALLAFCADTSQVVTIVVDRTGHVRWTQSDAPGEPHGLGGAGEDKLYVVTANAVVVYRQPSRRLEVFDPATGRLRWAADFDDVFDRLLAMDDTAMLIAYDKGAGSATQLMFRDTATGALRPGPAGMPADSFIEFRVRVRDGHVYLLANKRRDNVTAVDIDLAAGRVAGTAQFRAPVPGNLFATPVAAPDDVAADQGYALFDFVPDKGDPYVTAIALGPLNR